MKIGRNEPCPCGSGKKFKKCCFGKSEEQKYAEAIIDSQSSLKNDSRIKECLYPNHEECSERIIKAHAIQNNRILSKLALDGCVITLDGQSNLIFQGSQKKGRKIATTFTGFCSYHDKVLFQEIEDITFNCSQKQVFLLTYRTMSWHYHKKLEQINAHSIFHENMLKHGYNISRNPDFKDLVKGFAMAEVDNIVEKQSFDNCLLNKIYDQLSFCVWEIPYEISIAVSMMYGLEHDIRGVKLNDYSEDRQVKNIYLNIFPSNSNSYCIWSWLKSNDDFYSDFSNQFMELSIEDRENYLNNQLPRWTDSIVISPHLWNKWGNDIQEALITHVNFDSLYRYMEEEISMFAYEYMDIPWNFFDKIEVFKSER